MAAGVHELLDTWAAFGPPDDDQAAEFSLVAAPETSGTLEAAIATEAKGHKFVLRPAFLGALAEETEGRFWILTFPELSVPGHEDLAFETARALARIEGMVSARPVLVDSLIGAAMVDREAEAAFFSCSSDDPGPAERGWAPRGLGVLTAWRKTKGAGVRIASIDTGWSDHTQLADVIDNSKPHLNLVEPGADARDRFSTNVLLANPGHGTLVASVAASRGDVSADGTTDDPDSVVGTAPEAKVVPIRAIRSVVDLRQSRIPAAIEHAIATECDVIVMALGSAFPIEPVEVALRAAVRRGMLVVCAAGNCVGEVVFPARFAPRGLATAVAAVDSAYAPWEKTSKGDAVTVSAFGEAVWGARKTSAASPNTVIAPSQGTTLATALTAGVAALWIAAHGGRAKLKAEADQRGVTVQKMFNQLLAASAYRPPGWPRGMGAGLVNAAALVNRPLPDPVEAMVDNPVATHHVTPLNRFLEIGASERDSIAGLEAAALPEELAAEALWRFYVASSRRRLVAVSDEEGLEGIAPGSGASPGLAAALATRPRLHDLVR